jgi:hypothetical protein
MIKRQASSTGLAMRRGSNVRLPKSHFKVFRITERPFLF